MFHADDSCAVKKLVRAVIGSKAIVETVGEWGAVTRGSGEQSESGEKQLEDA